jgi:hypothetical protein
MSRTTGPYSGKDEQKLMTELWAEEIKDNPLAFVLFAYPWGEKNTPLEKFGGPRTWQVDLLLQIAEHIKNNKNRMANGKEPLLFQAATASGRGIGKSALVSWLVHWMMSCQLGSTSIVTANTEDQLKSKTWAEAGKWHTLGINSHWFEKTALSLKPEPWFQAALKNQLKIDTGYYYAQAQLWSEEKPDSFAGVHNPRGVLLIFDEASGIPKPIWTVSEGFFTEPELYRFWLTFSNPRRNTGPFFECFHAQRDFWNRRCIDSRTVEGTDKNLLNQIVEKYGEDSDEVRVEVKGEFPRQGDRQFISREFIQGAKARELIEDDWAPLIMGVDPARYGNDSTVIRFRQGRNARILPPVIMKGADNMEVANQCAHLINQYNPDAVCIDAGNGTGIIDRLKEMKFRVYEVWFGHKPEDQKWADKRTELWARMRDWLAGGCIDASSDLADDLAGPEYKFVQSDRLKLESKEDMKRRGLSSPDHGDALACTFAVKVARRDIRTSRTRNTNRTRNASEYSVLDY